MKYATIVADPPWPYRDGPLEARHSASFVTFGKPCEEALRDLSTAYNKLADQWEEQHATLRNIRALAAHNAERHTGFVHIGRMAAAHLDEFE